MQRRKINIPFMKKTKAGFQIGMCLLSILLSLPTYSQLRNYSCFKVSTIISEPLNMDKVNTTLQYKGSNMKKGGFIVGGVGVLLIAGGVALVNDGNKKMAIHTASGNKDISWGGALRTFSGGLFIFGGSAAQIGGVSMVIVGQKKINKLKREKEGVRLNLKPMSVNLSYCF